MKKTLILLVLALSLTLSLALPAQAAEISVEDALMEAIDWVHPFCGYFDNDSIPGEFIDMKLMGALQNDNGIFAEYLEYTYTTIDTANGPYTDVSGYTGEIPADVFEAYATEHFTNKEAVRAYMHSTPEKEYYDCYTYADGVYQIHYGRSSGKGGYYASPKLAGYKELGNNTYEVYYYEWFSDYYSGPYIYEEGDVEGVDYVLVEEYDRTTGQTTIKYRELSSFGEKAVIHLTDGGFEFASYGSEDRENFPTDMIKPEKKLTVAAQQEGISISMDGSQVPVGTALEIAPITDSTLLDSLTAALEDKGSLLHAYNFQAMDADGNPIENFQQPVELKLEIPADCANPAVYYVSDDGAVIEKIAGKIEDGYYICTLSHFSSYVLVNEPTPEIPEPSQPEDTQPEPSQPEASAPEASQPTDSSPNTGDNAQPIFLLLVLSAGALLTLLRKKQTV